MERRHSCRGAVDERYVSFRSVVFRDSRGVLPSSPVLRCQVKPKANKPRATEPLKALSTPTRRGQAAGTIDFFTKFQLLIFSSLPHLCIYLFLCISAAS